MIIKLCYVEYPFKITLGACKQFYDETGQDLQRLLIRYIQATVETREMSLLPRMNAFLSVESFEVAAEAIYALAKTENSCVTLDDIRDGMFKVSWLPSERVDDMSEPWPLVMLDIANQVDAYFKKDLPVKKKATKRKSK